MIIMNNKIQRKFKLIGVALAIVFGFGTLSAVQAQQNPNNRQDRKDDRRNDNQVRRGNDDRYENDRDDDRDNDNRNNGNYGNSNGGYYGNNSSYGSKNAFRQAFAEGLRRGADDARDGRRFNANRAAGKAMERMNNGRYNYGISRQEFREAFIKGYERGFRQYDDRNNDRNGRGNGRGY